MRPWVGLSLIALLCGAALRTIQFAAQSSLWVDEAALARNVLSRSLTALTQPLDSAQYAPIGFLALQKALITLGSSELVWRAVPFASSLASLVLFAVLARRTLSASASAVATAMFALGSAFIYFGSQAKQYSSDVALTLALLVFTERAIRQRPALSGWMTLGLAGAVACVFSHPVAIVLIALGITLAAVRLLQPDVLTTRSLMAVTAWWALGGALGAALARRSVSDVDLAYAQEVWTAWFAPFPPRTMGDLLWPWTTLVEAFGSDPFAMPRLDGGLRYPWPWLYGALTLLGFAAWWRRGARHVAMLIGLPLILALLTSAMALYPLGGRVSLYLLPLPILGAAEGWDAVCRAFPGAGRRVIATVLILVAPVLAIAGNLPPFYLEHLRPVLEDVRREWRDGDHMYVYYGAGQAFLLYAPTLGFGATDYTLGSCARARPDTYIAQLNTLAGRSRVWSVFTHSTGEGAEMVQLRAYLDRFGPRLHTIERPAQGAHVGAGAQAYLHDLSGQPPSDVPRSWSIDLWPWACYGTMTSGRSATP